MYASKDEAAAANVRINQIVERKSEGEQQITRVIADLQKEGIFDQRWLAIVKTDFEKAFMVLAFAVAEPLLRLSAAQAQETAAVEVEKCAKKAGREPGRCDRDYCFCGAEGSPSAS